MIQDSIEKKNVCSEDIYKTVTKLFNPWILPKSWSLTVARHMNIHTDNFNWGALDQQTGRQAKYKCVC